MKLFRTPLQTSVSTHTLSLQDKVLTAGSCFADAMGSRLGTHKVHTLQNPFGTLYNPYSIHKVLGYAIAGERPPEQGIVMNRDVYTHYDFHSMLSALTKEELTSRLDTAISTAHVFLKDASTIILTYGTAWIYTHIDTGEIVANCHKMPAKLFRKSLMTPEQVLQSFSSFYSRLKAFCPGIRMILTVSPVRHIKDTLPLNAVSKSVLRVACHALCEMYEDVEYFPAYEIVLDELRDYRFYKPDMIHPTEEAEDYIWEKFVESYFNREARDFFAQWEKVMAALFHRPFHASSPSNLLFLQNTLKKLEELKSVVNVDEEIALINERMNRKN